MYTQDSHSLTGAKPWRNLLSHRDQLGVVRPPPTRPPIRESGNVDRFLLSLLILNWREHIERAVPSLSIVKYLEVSERVAGELDTGFPLPSV